MTKSISILLSGQSDNTSFFQKVKDEIEINKELISVNELIHKYHEPKRRPTVRIEMVVSNPDELKMVELNYEKMKRLFKSLFERKRIVVEFLCRTIHERDETCSYELSFN
jgi:hypothetical protein